MDNHRRKQVYAHQRNLGHNVVVFSETETAPELRKKADAAGVRLPTGKKATKTVVIEALRAHNANAAVVDDMRLTSKQRRRLAKKVGRG